MQRLNDASEALEYIREGDIVTTDGKDQFLERNGRVLRYSEGTRYSLEIKDFLELYQKTVFYLYEESAEIDEEKDEAYYRYYRK